MTDSGERIRHSDLENKLVNLYGTYFTHGAFGCVLGSSELRDRMPLQVE